MIDHWNQRKDDDSQPRTIFEAMSPEQQRTLSWNTVKAIGDAWDPDMVLEDLDGSRYDMGRYGGPDAQTPTLPGSPFLPGAPLAR